MKTSPFRSWPYGDIYTLQPMTHKQSGNWLKGNVLVDAREYKTKEGMNYITNSIDKNEFGKLL